ncbi:Lipoprotein signal peptidase [hydrothermal vent metagenome]|uniref:Lipoprotein signal peptidase n=1 Tax=hydrothermal vent metagenome TaxID=652676 RepID=A0A3B0RTI5_9ZZZZ
MLARESHNGLLVIVIALFLDRVSKWWIMDILELPKIQMVKILPFFNLQWAENKGISFGMFPADGDLGRWGLVVVTLLIVIGLGVWLKSVQTRLLAIALGLVIGGALGNIYDRATLGYVADFFQFYVGNWSFYIFNVADSCISVGAALLVWDSFFGPKPEQATSDQDQS